METIAADIFGMLDHCLALTIEINEQDMMADGGGSDDGVIRLDLRGNIIWIIPLFKVWQEMQVRRVGNGNASARIGALQAVQQRLQVASVAVWRNIVADVVDGKPDGNQIGMSIEGYRQFKVERLVQCDAGDAEIDQARAGAKFSGEIGGPVLGPWVIRAEAKSIRRANRHVEQMRGGILLHDSGPLCAAGRAAARQKEQKTT